MIVFFTLLLRWPRVHVHSPNGTRCLGPSVVHGCPEGHNPLPRNLSGAAGGTCGGRGAASVLLGHIHMALCPSFVGASAKPAAQGRVQVDATPNGARRRCAQLELELSSSSCMGPRPPGHWHHDAPGGRLRVSPWSRVAPAGPRPRASDSNGIRSVLSARHEATSDRAHAPSRPLY
jgi:hypothetical protein